MRKIIVSNIGSIISVVIVVVTCLYTLGMATEQLRTNTQDIILIKEENKVLLVHSEQIRSIQSDLTLIREALEKYREEQKKESLSLAISIARIEGKLNTVINNTEH